ncbi:HAD family hydrolase [Streptomyces sp. NPDC003077]|uniref:HAD family hydrolase n=1 Tax=Streptomyces sp. NPDC003077 TaxID=3154443 RepID=UPI0033BDBABF
MTRTDDAFRFRTVVFDLDAVLVDSFAVTREAFTRAARDIVGEGDPPFAEHRSHQGRHFPDVMRREGLPGALEKPFAEAGHRLIDRVTVYPGVPPLLETLRDAGIRTAVATGTSGIRARAVLDAVGLLPLLGTVVGSDEVPRPKPWPDIVREALDRLASPPATALLVGDAVLDIRSGRAAGTATAGATWGEGAVGALRAAAPDFLLDHPVELLPLVSGVSAR